MNASASISLILALMTFALPATAQEQTETPSAFDLRSPTTGPIARAATREAVRLETTFLQSGTPALSDWRSVRQLAPRAEIIVIVKGTPPARRYFVSADESELIMANRAGEVEHIARTDLAEISVLGKHVGRHTHRGLLVGGIVGAAIMGTTFAQLGCGSSAFECLAVEVVAAAGGAGYGALIGGVVGSVAPRSPDVIYRAP